jgi:glycerophosphoryl diester phosphodiesterase
MKRIGHKGADLIEPGNTVASFDVALRHGVHMIELDVLPEHNDGSGSLFLAHDYHDLAKRRPLTLEEGLEHLASEKFSEIGLIADLKLPGYEEGVVRALQQAGLEERTLISTTYRQSLPLLRATGTVADLGWSVPRAKRDYTKSVTMAVPAMAFLTAMRATLPRRAAEALRSNLCDALMVYWRLVTPRLVRAVQSAGGDLYVWTVDHAPRIRTLEALGVTGVITNDPRLFESPEPVS